jgi:putative DNA primase/helicase
MDIKSFCLLNQMKFIEYLTIYNKSEDGSITKSYKGIQAGWNKKSLSELVDISNNNKSEFTNYLINCNNKFIIFDTDDSFSYAKLYAYLKKKDMIFNDSISISSRGNEFYYKRHFWFKVEDERFNTMKKHKAGDMEIFIGSNCFISEKKETILKVENILTYEMHLEILSLFEPLEVIKDKVVIKPKTKEEKPIITVSENQNLINILENLKPERFINNDDWIRIYWVFLNEKLPLELFKHYSKKYYASYDEDRNEKILKHYRQVNDGYKIATLYKMLKEDNLEMFNVLQSSRVDFWDIFADLKNHVEPANFYYQMYPHKYIKSNLTGWYEYNHNNILIPRGNNYPSSMLNSITTTFQNLLIEQRNLIVPKAKDDKEYNERMKIFKNAYNKVGTTTFINNVKEYLTHLYTVEKIDDLIDSNVNLIAFENILYDNTIKDFRKIKPTDYISKTCRYDINTKSEPALRTYLETLIRNMFLTDEIYNYHLQTIALSLFGNINETFIINSGKGRNGKGICGQLIEKALGDYFYSGESTFYTTVFRADRPNSTLYNLKGVRYFLTTEPEADSETKFNIGLIKKTTGNDTITTRDLNKSNISYKPQFTPFLQCNNKPKIDSFDNAIKNRFRIIDFPFTFCQEPTKLNEKKIDITIKENLNQALYNEFMLMLLDISKKMNKNIIVPKEVLGNVDEYLNSNNDVKRWLESVFDFTDDKKDCFTSTELLSEFNTVGDYMHLSPKKFSEQMTINNIKSKLVKGTKYFYGLKRKEEINEFD